MYFDIPQGQTLKDRVLGMGIYQNPYMGITVGSTLDDIRNGYNNLRDNYGAMVKYLQGTPGFNNKGFENMPYYFDYN